MLLEGAEAAPTECLLCAVMSKRAIFSDGVLTPSSAFVQLRCPTEIRNRI